MFIMSAISYSELTYDRKSMGTYVYPKWAVSIGWLLACTSFIGIPVYMIQEVVSAKRKGKVSKRSFAQNFKCKLLDIIKLNTACYSEVLGEFKNATDWKIMN
jgi:hypothetical protein